MNVINPKDPSQKQATSICIVSPDKTEAVCFEPQELEELIAELSSGRIALDYLAEHLKLTCHQLYYVVEHLRKTGKVSGELTYSTFTSSGTSKLLHLEKIKVQKRMHRQKMREKGK
ncbi:hypothetical protein GX563_04350 [Candidatus Bathyarchaeota archaeon]|nr:hypothetical protein [Candidatus Bathyarchaeota archaeon]